LAASEAERELLYYTFKDEKQQQQIENFVSKLLEMETTVGIDVLLIWLTF
jgi:hypothetical protein